MKVRATKQGFIGGKRQRIGDEFECTQAQFSSNWMEKINKPGKKKAEKPVEKEEEVVEKVEDLQEAQTFKGITSTF